MGNVYRVEDTKVKEEVALKLIRPEIAADKNTIERFRNELRIARKIRHQNVCQMYDLGEEEGTHFITMEYIPGEDLKSLITRVGHLPIDKAISLARQISEGLADAHRLGIVHRDLKSRNIMIDKNGNARIMDFGLARSIESDEITGTGTIVGTPKYMSPEQVEGKEVDHRSDVYSLGIILYEMVTGKVPFTADTNLAIAMKHREKTPKDPKTLNPQIPDHFRTVILKCLEKKKENRYQSVKEIISELENFKAGTQKVQERRKLSRLLLTPIYAKKKKSSHKPETTSKIKKLRKYSKRTFVLLFVLYVSVSAIGLVNDVIYKEKLKRIKIEADTYYKNIFPMKRDWLSYDWKTRNCNVCDTYIKLFPPRSDETGKTIPPNEYETEYVKNLKENPPRSSRLEIFKEPEYSSPEELKSFVDKFGKYYKFDELFDGLKCAQLNPNKLIQNDQLLYTVFIIKYLRMIVLKARIDFLDGNYEDGLVKIHNSLLFSLDLILSSPSLIGGMVSSYCFRWLYKELIPVLLAEELNVESKILGNIEKLILQVLEKTELEPLFYREFLWLGTVKPEDWGFSTNKFGYFLYDKLYFWKYGFSIKRYIYSMASFYQGLFEGLKYIRDKRNKNIYIIDYFENRAQKKHILLPSDETNIFRHTIVRTLGKAISIIINIKKYGMNSSEFLELKGTDCFINELSGEKFEIIEEGPEKLIVIDREYHLSLKNIRYENQHKEILESLKHFDIDSIKKISSLLSYFEIE